MDQIEQLSKITAQGTTLISYYVPAGKDMSLVNNHINSEMSQSANIKSAQTRIGVQGALRMIRANLNGMKTHSNGTAIFASNEFYL